MIGHHKLILLIGKNDIDALVSYEKLIFPSFFSVKVHLLIETNTDSHSNSFLSMIGHLKLILLTRINGIDASVS